MEHTSHITNFAEYNKVGQIYLDYNEEDLIKVNGYKFTTKDTRLLFDVEIDFELYGNHYKATLECNGVIGKSGRFSKKFCRVAEVSVIEKDEKILYRNKKYLPIFVDKSIKENPDNFDKIKGILRKLKYERDTIFKIFKNGK